MLRLFCSSQHGWENDQEHVYPKATRKEVYINTKETKIIK